jgi:hypothetical protein
MKYYNREFSFRNKEKWFQGMMMKMVGFSWLLIEGEDYGFGFLSWRTSCFWQRWALLLFYTSPNLFFGICFI